MQKTDLPTYIQVPLTELETDTLVTMASVGMLMVEAMSNGGECDARLLILCVHAARQNLMALIGDDDGPNNGWNGIMTKVSRLSEAAWPESDHLRMKVPIG